MIRQFQRLLDFLVMMLWDDKIGSIEVGKKADIITMDLKGPEMWPVRDIVANLVYAADAGHVDNVIIDGKFVVRDRQILTVKEEEVISKVSEVVDSVLGRAGVRVEPKWSII